MFFSQIAFNLDKLLEDRHIAEILGLYDAAKFNVSELVADSASWTRFWPTWSSSWMTT